MPNPTFHLDLAWEFAAKLRHAVIEANMGSFLLGSCAPDIRVITRGQRDDTHFAPLSNQVVGTGVRNMFQAFPALGRTAALSGPTQAFVAGYISHLVADETWITRIYRLYFGNGELFRDRVTGNVMDRALQLDLDRCAREKQDEMKHILSHLKSADVAVEVEFLPADALAAWRDWLISAMERNFTWDRLQGMAVRRQEPQEHERAQQVAEQFVRALPESLERLYSMVPREAVGSYRSATMQEWANLVTGYLP